MSKKSKSTEEVSEQNSSGAVRKKRLSKKHILAIIAAVLIVVLLAGGLTVWLVMFNDEVYDLDINQFKIDNQPLFSDDFDVLDESIWSKQGYFEYRCLNCGKVTAGLPTQCEQCGNNNPANFEKGNCSQRRGGYWSPEQVFVEDGNLVIRTENKDGKWMTGAITSCGDVGLYKTYGYFEAKCILPKGYGLWSAFWLMSNNYGRDNLVDASVVGAEIDIFESPYWPSNRVQQAIHTGGYDNKNHKTTSNPRWLFTNYEDLYDTYHTYGLYWNKDIYKFYLDGKCIWTTSCGKNVSKVNEYLFLSVEIGGANGVANKNQWFAAKTIGKNKEGNAFRSDFKIDYVKVWDVPESEK